MPAAAWAQAAPPPQPQPQTREQLDIGARVGQPAPSPSRVEIRGGIERGPCPLADPSFAQTRVTFSRVDFAGLKAVDPVVLDDTWRDYAGTDQPVAVLCEVRDRAATALRAMGYLAAVQIPPQRIDKNGEVRMDVLVARLTEVQVLGDAGANAGAIAGYLAQLEKQPYFNTNVAQRQLLLMSDIPGYEVRLTLKPVPGAPGDVSGDVLVRRRPFEIYAGVQNLGAKATGEAGAFVQLVANGVTGMADQTTLSGYNAFDFKRQSLVQLDHNFAIGASGLRFDASILYAHSKTSGSPGFVSEAVVGQVGLSYPLVERRASSLVAGGGLEVIDQDVDFGSTPLARDHLRVVYGRLGLSVADKASFNGAGGYTGAEPRFRMTAVIEARKGIDGLGASQSCTIVATCLAPNVPISNLLAVPDGFVLRASASAEFRPTPMITIAATPRAQYSPDTLLSYERYSVGNYTAGRGLDPGTLQGDSGLGSSFELRYGRLSRAVGNAVALQPFAFFDAAWVWRNDAPSTADPQSAYTAGGGIRARWGDRIDGNFTLSVPLKDSGFAQSRGDVRFLFTIRARLMPWNR